MDGLRLLGPMVFYLDRVKAFCLKDRVHSESCSGKEFISLLVRLKRILRNLEVWQLQAKIRLLEFLSLQIPSEAYRFVPRPEIRQHGSVIQQIYNLVTICQLVARKTCLKIATLVNDSKQL